MGLFSRTRVVDPYNTMGNSGAKAKARPAPEAEAKRLRPQAAARYNALVAEAHAAYDRGDKGAYDEASEAAGQIWYDPKSEATR